MAPDGSMGSGTGNTSGPRVAASKHWCFTLNNYTNDDVNELVAFGSDGSLFRQYVFQEETGENGTPHLQGYIEFGKKQRPFECINNKRIHWEKCRSPKASIAYCSKEDTRTGSIYTNIRLPKPLRLIKDLYEWQQRIVDLVQNEPDDRTVYWYWEETGNIGKTALCKYLCVKYNAICLSGKGSDCKYAIVKFHENTGTYPDIILYDIPRVMNDYVSYDALESIKNGLFFSTKYESCQVVMNSPWVFCFSNSPPDTSKMSLDRWKIVAV